MFVIAHAVEAWNSKAWSPALALDWRNGARHPYSRTLQIREKDRWGPAWAHTLVPESHGLLLTIVFAAGAGGGSFGDIYLGVTCVQRQSQCCFLLQTRR